MLCLRCCRRLQQVWEFWAPGDGPKPAGVTLPPRCHCIRGFQPHGRGLQVGSHQLPSLQGSFSPGCPDERCLSPGHSPCLQAPAGCELSPLTEQGTSLSPCRLLSCWPSEGHVTGVTSPRHWGLEVDLMSLRFPQLRKTSKKLSPKHPGEPTGLSASVTVPTGGQR